MPDPAGQVFKPIDIPELPPLPLDPPFLEDFEPTMRLTQERLNFILATIPEGFLSPREIDLLVFVLRTRDLALAFTDAERGTFSRAYYPDYEIPVIEHIPWVQPPIRVPKSIEETVRKMLLDQKAAGKYEYSTASYRSRIFTVLKKLGLRIVHDVQELNKVTVRDSALPPRVDDFAEGLVGRVIYGLADLFAGYDGRILAVSSRPLTTFNSVIGPHRLTVLPQGATNSVPEFQRCIRHALREDIPENGDVFIDDVSFAGGTSTYDDEEIAPGIRRFVYEYATTVDRFLVRFITAGITASGWKFVLATPKLNVVGTTVSREGWHLGHGLVTKIINWPEPQNVSEVRGFLGTAGVGRKWIRSFSLIAKPLTILTKQMNLEFYFDDAAREAFEKLKELVTEAPVLVRLNYDTAKLITALPRSSDEGLVAVAVDSCSNGAGWVVYQNVEGEKHPVIYGSCTFSETESRYSQPKCELFGVFRALKDLRHRIWGIHFRLDVDAKFLVEMIKSPDLPNAPMTRWVMYLSLFDFEVNHVAADKHQAPDGLSRRRRSNQDSDDEDAEEYLDKFIGSVKGSCPLPSFPLTCLSLTALATNCLDLIMSSFRPRLRVPYADFGSPTNMSTVSSFQFDEEDHLHNADVGAIYNYNGFGFDPSRLDLAQCKGNLLMWSLLKSTDSLSYTGHEFENRHTPTTTTVEFLLGEELIELETTTYGYEYMSRLCKGAPPVTFVNSYNTAGPIGAQECTDTRRNYEDVDPKGHIACISHAYGTKDFESPEHWQEILAYLKDGIIPERCENLRERKKFLSRTRVFVFHDGRLWKLQRGGKTPRLVITDLVRRRSLLAQVHNEVGHRGRDGTYKLLSERYYWPNLYDDVAYFVRSCYSCQLRSKMRPKIPFSPTWNSAILRCFHLDTVHMEKGRGGMRYLLHAQEPAIEWPEARAARQNTSEAWADFIYQDIICRFGCIPYCVIDGGSEFKGAARILFARYGVTVILSSPYHPQGNAVVERAHQVLVNALVRVCGDHPSWWPLFLHAVLLAIRCTASRMTGHSPYYLLLGRQPLLAFDIADRTWESLDWDKVITTEDLITIRAQQIARRDNILEEALEKQKRERQRAVDDFNNRYEKYLVTNDFDIGTWVLVHETWLDNQKGNKLAPRWTGPFAIHRKLSDTTYQIREIDGTIKRGKVSKDRLKLFYYRKDLQTIKSVSSSFPILGRESNPTYDSYPYTVARVPLDGLDHGMWMVPHNVNLVKYPIFLIGNRKEYTQSMIGELDNILGTEDADECSLLDPVFPLPIIRVDSTRRQHNIIDLLEMTSEFLHSSASTLH